MSGSAAAICPSVEAKLVTISLCKAISSVNAVPNAACINLKTLRNESVEVVLVESVHSLL